MYPLLIDVYGFGFRLGMEIDRLRMLLSMGESQEAGVDSETWETFMILNETYIG